MQIPLIAPVGTPGVHYDPVLLIFIGRYHISIADYQDYMISFCPAASRCYNALFVKAEHVSGSLDYYGHRHNFNSLLDGVRP